MGKKAGLPPDNLGACLQLEALGTKPGFYQVSKGCSQHWPTPFLGSCPNLNPVPRLTGALSLLLRTKEDQQSGPCSQI